MVYSIQKKRKVYMKSPKKEQIVFLVNLNGLNFCFQKIKRMEAFFWIFLLSIMEHLSLLVATCAPAITSQLTEASNKNWGKIENVSNVLGFQKIQKGLQKTVLLLVPVNFIHKFLPNAPRQYSVEKPKSFFCCERGFCVALWGWVRWCGGHVLWCDAVASVVLSDVMP